MYFKQLVISIRTLIVLTLLTGVAYPFAITGIVQIIFPHQANGSLIMKEGRVIGSELIGQSFSDPKYFWARLSATGPVPFNGASSSGSNLGPLNPALMKAVHDRIDALHKFDLPASRLGPQNSMPIPVDLVTASASGLDPHITPASARYQIKRVANTRNLSENQVMDLVKKYTQGRFLGVIGEPTVNVLKLNLAIDELAHESKT